MWDLPGPGLEPTSLALADGFLTTVPPGKPLLIYFKNLFTQEVPQITNIQLARIPFFAKILG